MRETGGQKTFVDSSVLQPLGGRVERKHWAWFGQLKMGHPNGGNHQTAGNVTEERSVESSTGEWVRSQKGSMLSNEGGPNKGLQALQCSTAHSQEQTG